MMKKKYRKVLGWVLSNWGPKPKRPNQFRATNEMFLKGSCCLPSPSNFRSHLSQRTILDVLTIRRWKFVRSGWNFSRRFLSYCSSFCPVGLLIGVLQKRQKFCEVLLTAANFCQRKYSLFLRSNGENISDSSEIFTGASWLILLHFVRCDLKLELYLKRRKFGNREILELLLC